jgi:4-amino-4-deoxy-L-arabinose transferase-like glycosyltransferase
MSKWLEKSQKKPLKYNLLILLFIWLIGVIIDRLWFSLDTSVPAWDQADYLNGAMIYWHALKTADFFNPDWWRNFWLLSNKIPPLTYILTAPFLSIFGASADAATLVLSLFSAILLISVYGLGALLFNSNIGLYAGILCQLLPGLYFYRLEFLLDYPLTAVVTFSFACLTFWKFNQNKIIAWWLAILWGLSLGIALMIKQTSLFFLFFPIVWVFLQSIIKRKWSNLAQLMLAFLVSTLVFFSWYRTNWLLIFTSGKRATIDSAIAEGDPALNTIGAWTYYGKVLPYLLSWPLLIILLICLIYLVISKFLNPSKGLFKNNNHWHTQKQKTLIWLGIFLIGGYLLSSLNINKDARYILPLLPVLSLVLTAIIFSWRGIGKQYLPMGIIALSLLLMFGNLFPLGGKILTKQLSPRVEHYPYFGEQWHHQEVIAEIIKTSPYLRSNVGVLPSTPEINQHNFSFYGSIPNFQVFGRQVGVAEKKVNQDVRSLDWFLTKTGEQGSIPEAQKATVNLVKNNGEFNLQNSWQLPDRSTLELYHRITPSVKVYPLATAKSKVKLEQVIIPEKSPLGLPIPVTYKWSGNWQELQEGIVLLTWQKRGENETQKWIHDHGIGMGNLHSGNLKQEDLNKDFQVIENTAMLPNFNLDEGNYSLKGIYLNRKTGEHYQLETPPIEITLDDNISPTPAPELDLVTQLRNLAPNLAEGIKGLDPIFAEIGRINQYDPIQDYLKVSEKALDFRLQNEQNLDYLYGLVLAQVLQQDITGAIASLKQLIKVEPNNAYNHAYLGFVYLYDWQGKEGEKALQPALKLQPDLREFQILDGIAGLMQGNLIKAWQTYQTLITNN